MSELNEIDAGFEELERLAAGQAAPSVHVRFFIEPMEDVEAGKKTGKRIFRDVEMIQKQIPGDKDIVRREARDKDKRQYAALYVAFKKQQSQEAVSGFPIREWALCTRAEAETLAAAGVRTVEQLAGAPLDIIKHVGPYSNLQSKAQDWLKQEKSGAELAALRERINQLETANRTMEAMLQRQTQEIEAARANGGSLPPVAAPSSEVAELKSQMAALMAAVQAKPAPKKRGRPPKVKTEVESN